MALTTYNCTALTGGGTRALDAISVSALADGDRALCSVGGEFLYFMFNDTATDAEDVTNHPYKVRPDDYVDGGVWVEQQVLGAGGGACLGGFKNKIINGNFDVWQRGVTFDWVLNNQWVADRFQYNRTGTHYFSISQSTDVPTAAQAGIKATSSLKFDCVTADATLGTTDKSLISQKIEGYNIRDLMGKSCTLSFWVKSNKTGIYSVALRSSNADYSYVSEYTINSSSTWEKKTITFTMADGSTGTWNYTTGIGLYLSFTLLCGTTGKTSTLDQWQSADKIASTNQINLSDSTANEWFITLIQLEVGDEATDFENRMFKEELALCQRYYEKSCNLAVFPGIANTTSQITGIMENTTVISGSPFEFKSSKRTSPTVYSYSPSSGSGGYLRDTTAGADRIADAVVSENHLVVSVYTGGVSGNAISLHWDADAEL